MDALSIAPYLNSCREVVERELITSVSGYNRLQWLWYLRRLPRHVFQGTLATTYGYDSGLAEVLSDHGHKDATTEDSTINTVYKIDHSVVRRILKFCGGVKFLSQLHVLHRLAGKGSHFSFSQSQHLGLPEAQPSIAVAQAIRLYDKRTAAGADLLNRVGTRVSSDYKKDRKPSLPFSLSHWRSIHSGGSFLVDDCPKSMLTSRLTTDLSPRSSH